MSKVTAGIPTVYNGITYRSRIEARWAVMFQLLGLRVEYEPFDGNGYIPDFLILGESPLVVEVKSDADTAAMGKHAEKIDRGLNGVWGGDVLIVGASPFPWCGDRFAPPAVAGLFGEFTCDEDEGGPRWWQTAHWITCPGGVGEHWGGCNRVGWAPCDGHYRTRPCGHYYGGHLFCADGEDETYINAMWREAHELTRWNPK